MTPDEFRAARKAMGLTQTELAVELGMQLRQIQNLEKGTAELRRIHALAIERVTLAYAVGSGKPDIAGPPIRKDALAFADIA